MILLLRQKINGHTSQKKKKGNIFFVYFLRKLPLFPTGVVLPFHQKAKINFSRLNTLRDGISGTNKKDDTHPN